MSESLIRVAALEETFSESTLMKGPNPSVQLIETLAQQGRYFRRAPFCVDISEIDPAQEGLVKAYFASKDQEHRAVQHVVLRNATLVGQGTVITSSSELIRESAAEFLAHGKTPDGLIASSSGGFVTKDMPEVFVEAPSLLVKRPWYGNYGHWIVDSAALCAMAARLSLPPRWQAIVGRQAGAVMRKIVTDTTDLLLPSVAVLEHPDDQLWHFEELHYVTPIHVPPLFKLPEGLACLRSLFLRNDLSHARKRNAIYVTRGAAATRKLANEAEVVALCNQLDIAVVSPEKMSIHAQANLFHQAHLVLGVKGAALTNALFCNPRTHVVAMSPADFPDPFFWDLVSLSGVGYSEIFGRTTSHGLPQGQNGFAIDIPKLRKILELCLDDLL
jgi:hypothetical protein